jgi:transposase InsO family protein
MRDNSFDRTVERNYIQKWRFLIAEYEAVKAGRSERFRRVGEFYAYHNTCSQTFRKYYNRFLASGEDAALLPQRRGPKWKERRGPGTVEELVLAERLRGQNRYEIYAVLRDRGAQPPSPVTIYRILRRHGVNRLNPPMREEKRKLIKTKVGELGHIDLHQIPQDVFLTPPAKPVYVISLVDSCSRLAWAELVACKKALPVMFKALKLINTLNARYGACFAEILSDNGAEFCGRTKPEEHPFEAMLLELGVKHRYTRPYRPQTNGKVERFWRTLDDDVINGATFENPAQLAEEVLEYMLYYNELRPHQAISGRTPKAAAEAAGHV